MPSAVLDADTGTSFKKKPVEYREQIKREKKKK